MADSGQSDLAEELLFDDLNALRLFLDGLLVRAVSALEVYYDKPSGGFIHVQQPGRRTNKFSMASTATCAAFLVDSGRWRAEGAPWGDKASTLVGRIIDSDWDSADLGPRNPFTTSFLLEAIADLRRASRVRLTARQGQIIRRRLARLQGALSEGVGIAVVNYPATSFLTYKAARALKEWDSLTEEIAETTADWAWRQLFEEGVLVAAKHRDSDVFELAYAALTVSLCTQVRNMQPRQREALDYALSLFFDRQNDRGLWPRSRPLFLYPKLGNAYCYDYELLTSMLGDNQLRPLLRRQLRALAKSAYALDESKIPLQEVSNSALAIDADPVGWSSGHLRQEVTRPESWTTSSAFHFCHRLQRLVVDAIREALFDYASELYTPPDPRDGVSEIDPIKFLDSEISRGPRFKAQSLTGVLQKQFLEPIAMNRSEVRMGQPLPRGVPCSAILFGPPGTSKTELARVIASYLGWPLLTLDPSNLTRNGLGALHAETNRLFTMLEAAEEMVVLFDEFDELVRERDEEGSDSASRFLTTAMLPKLTALSSRRRIVYLLATNHLERFDSAVRRPGRFDLIVPVMPPTLDSKLRRWPEVAVRLRAVRIGTRAKADKELRGKLGGLTYLEFEDLVPRLLKARTRRTVERVVEEADARAILNQSPTNDDHTWLKRIESETKRIRI